MEANVKPKPNRNDSINFIVNMQSLRKLSRNSNTKTLDFLFYATLVLNKRHVKIQNSAYRKKDDIM